MVDHREVVIASLPYVDTDEPLMAPGLLKGLVDRTGRSSLALDLNIEIIHRLAGYKDIESQRVLRWFLYEEFTDCERTKTIIGELVQFAADRIMSCTPRWICLSLFCNTAKKFNVELCRVLRSRDPGAKIVIGGNAVFTDPSSKRPYAKILQRAGLIDHFIVGDGEEPLFNLLMGHDQPGADQEEFQVLEDLGQQPYSNYDDYDWEIYTTKRVPMYGSRGCVRRCTFCDVYKLWKKFKIRDAQEVFNEMLYQIDRTGIRDFYFRDSLINGSISEFRRLMHLIAEYNRGTAHKIRWHSFFIFRPQTQMPESDWALAAQGGADTLVIGVESLVDSIRYHMRKKFTNADIDHGLAMAKKYNIRLWLLLIIGYVNETEQDFEAAIQWLYDHQQYARDPISFIGVGGTLTVTDLTDLYQKAEDFDITIGQQIHLWENRSINLTYEVREQRKKIFIDTAKKLGYNIEGHEKPVS
jgi:hypothetical protein